MGIKGLLKAISDNKERVCSEVKPIRGKLVVDGYGMLHELYDSNMLEWANGGCYAQQHRATTDFFNSLLHSGIEPIVILDGGGSKASIEDTVHRRNENIGQITERLRKHHVGHSQPEYRLPLLSRHIYIRSLKEINGVQVYTGDGKAHKTVVSLANHYECPVLTNNTIYCVSGVAGGVIFFKHLDITSCRASVYSQERLLDFLCLRDPNLIFAVVAICGDRSKQSVPSLYYGKIRANIERSSSAPAIELKSRSWVLNVADYFRNQHINSWQDFKRRLPDLRFVGQTKKLVRNCRKAQDIYNLSSSTLSVDVLQCESSCRLPDLVVKDYRNGKFPAILVDAICVGDCILDASVGDEEQPPITHLGLPVRKMMYGLALPLMDRRRRCINEYHRSETKPWNYAQFEVVIEPHRSLSLLHDKDEQFQEVSKSAICEVLQSPDVLTVFQDRQHIGYALAALVSLHWARHLLQSQQMDHPEQLIKALVLNFLYSRDLDEAEIPSHYSHPMWVKAYHAILEWQSLYQDVCNLNSALGTPLPELPLTNTLDSPFVMELALHPSPNIITTYHGRLDSNKQDVFDMIIGLINIQQIGVHLLLLLFLYTSFCKHVYSLQ